MSNGIICFTPTNHFNQLFVCVTVTKIFERVFIRHGKINKPKSYTYFCGVTFQRFCETVQFIMVRTTQRNGFQFWSDYGEKNAGKG